MSGKFIYEKNATLAQIYRSAVGGWTATGLLGAGAGFIDFGEKNGFQVKLAQVEKWQPAEHTRPAN